jgi:hypothetical protein
MKMSVLILACFNLAITAFSSVPDSLFTSDEIIKITLRADYTALLNDRDKTAVYREGVLIYYTPSGDSVKLDVKLMVRGHFRRDPANCAFPPLFVNFKKSEVKNTVFRNQDKIKLVTPCHAEEDIIEEYMVYKMYNLVTDMSLKVRLVRILYFDTGLNKEVFEKFSFFVEHEDDAAERNNAFVTSTFITPFSLNPDNAKKLSVFQYIVGNKDWQYTSRHNIFLFQPYDTTQPPYAVPYDFDFSGFVNAHYSKPKGVPEDLLPSRRLYNGICYSPEEFYRIFDYFRTLKPKFESIINSTEYISKSRRREKIAYLYYFYNGIKDNDLFQRDFLAVCRTKKDFNIVE